MDYLDGLFTAARAAELAAGGTGYETTRRRNLFLTQLHVILVRGTTKMIQKFSAPIVTDHTTAAPAPTATAPP